jgi:hypothetical protein
MTMIPSFEVMSFVGLVGLESQGRSREPHPVVVGLYACPVGPYLDSGLPYLLSPSGGPILSAAWRRDGACSETTVASDLVDLTSVPTFVRAGVHGQSLTLPRSSQGLGRRRGCATLCGVW